MFSVNGMQLIVRIGFAVTTGPGCSKLTMSLVNVSLKFHMLISQIC